MAFNGTISVNNGSGVASAAGLAASRQSLQAQLDTIRSTASNENGLIRTGEVQAVAAARLVNDSRDIVAGAVHTAQMGANTAVQSHAYSDNATELSNANAAEITRLGDIIQNQEEDAANASR